MILEDEQVSFSDNSHLIGIPILFTEEVDGFIKAPRSMLKTIMALGIKLQTELHVEYTDQ